MQLTKDNSPISKRILEEFFVHPSRMAWNLSHALRQVCEGDNLVALSYNNEAYDEPISSFKCKISQIPKPIVSTPTRMRLALHSPFAQIFNQKYAI